MYARFRRGEVGGGGGGSGRLRAWRFFPASTVDGIEGLGHDCRGATGLEQQPVRRRWRSRRQVRLHDGHVEDANVPTAIVPPDPDVVGGGFKENEFPLAACGYDRPVSGVHAAARRRPPGGDIQKTGGFRSSVSQILRLPSWALHISSRVGKRIHQSVVQGGRDFPYIRVGGGQ